MVDTPNPWQAESDAIDAALKAAQPPDQPAPVVGGTPPASGNPWQAESDVITAGLKQPPGPPPEVFGPPQQPWKSNFWPWSTDETGKANYFDPSAGVIGKALDAFTLARDVNTGRQQIYNPGGTLDPSFVDRTLNFATLANPTSAAARAEGVVIPGVSTARQVPTSAQLTAAGTPQRAPGGQFLPGTPAFTADPRNLAAANRADAITDLAKPPITGTAVPIREQVATFIQDPVNQKKFSPGEIKLLDDFAKGGTWTGKIGNLLTETVLPAMASGGGTLMGFHYGDIGGGVLGSILGPTISNAFKPILGWPFKKWENARASGALDAIGEMLRSRSPLGEQSKTAARPQYPGRAIPSLLSPVVPQQPPAVPGRYPDLPATGPIPAGLLSPWA